MRVSNRRGYTLIELVVTVLIIGILTAIAVPQYLQTVETGKADDAVATVNMIATTNKMFALDHNGAYVTGPFTTGAGGVCGAAAATACSAAPSGNACDLVWCKYLADQDWADKPYVYNACGGGAGGGTCAGTMTAAAARNPANAGTSYTGWGYKVDVTGAISAVGGAPPPTY